MLIQSKHLTIALALMFGAGAYPITAIAQAQAETDNVRVQTSEAEERAGDLGEAAGDALSDIGQALGDAAEGTAEVIEQGVQDTGEAIKAQIQTSDDLDDSQKLELEQAAAEGKPIPRPEIIIGIQKEGQWLSSELVGREVRNPQGEIIGKIEAILFGDEGPDGFVVQVGGPPGIAAKSVAIEWDGVTITEDSVLVEATGEELENAPEFVSLEEQRAEAVPPR